MSHRESYSDAAARFMERYGWDIYCTPTWRYPVTLSRARRDIREFVTRFGDQSFAYATYETGRLGGRIHAHLSLGGLNRIAQSRGNRLWRYGQIKWEPYIRGGGAGRYLWKNAKDQPETGEFLGMPRRAHPRKRGRRGRGAKQRSKGSE
jgi:hypothetical protein